MPLGRVLGLLLDRHASTEPGQATVIHESDEEGVEESRLFWNNASVWRLERRGGGVVSDGLHEQEWRGRNGSRRIPRARRTPHGTSNWSSRFAPTFSGGWAMTTSRHE